MLGLYLQGGLWVFFSGAFENQSFPTGPGVSQGHLQGLSKAVNFNRQGCSYGRD